VPCFRRPNFLACKKDFEGWLSAPSTFAELLLCNSLSRRWLSCHWESVARIPNLPTLPSAFTTSTHGALSSYNFFFSSAKGRYRDWFLYLTTDDRSSTAVVALMPLVPLGALIYICSLLRLFAVRVRSSRRSAKESSLASCSSIP